MQKEQRIKRAMSKMENVVRHVYNCGYNDGYDAARDNILPEEKARRNEAVLELLNEITKKIDENIGLVDLVQFISERKKELENLGG